METKCSVCGAPMENGKCSYCGHIDAIPVQVPNELYGESPRKEEIQEQQFSYNQIFEYTDIVPGVSRKSKTTALLLCIFLGGLGAHKFYVGKIGMGVLYLLTIGLFGVGWIVDIFLIATGTFKDEFDLPLQQ